MKKCPDPRSLSPNSLLLLALPPSRLTGGLSGWLPFLFQKRGNNSFQSAPLPPNERGRTRNPVFPTLRKIRVTGGAAERRRRLRRLNIQIFSINLRIFEVEATFSFTFDRPSAAKISSVHHPRNNNNFRPRSRPHLGTSLHEYFTS